MSIYKSSSLAMIPTAYKDGKLYSVRPTDGSGDFTFSRGSNLAATRVASSGYIEKGRENLLLQSNQFDTTWIIARLALIDNQSGYDNNNDAWKVTPDTNSNTHAVYQSGVAASNGVYTYSVYAKANGYNYIAIRDSSSTDGYAKFDLVNGLTETSGSTAVDSNITNVGNGWWRCSLSVNKTSGAANNFIIYVNETYQYNLVYSGNGTDGVYIQDAQAEQGLVATDYIETGASTAQAGILEDMPRLDYSGGASCPSLLLEPQRTNLIPQSEYFGAWNNTSYPVTITSNAATSPDGNTNATLITPTSGSDRHAIREINVVAIAGTTYTLSAFFKKAGSRYVVFGDSGDNLWRLVTADLDEGTITNETNATGTIEPYENDWYRITCTFTRNNPPTIQTFLGASPNDTNIAAPSFDNTSLTTYVYGAQVEASSSYPTSYIPTYGSSVTRSEDVCGATGLSSVIGQTQGVIFMDFIWSNSSPTGGDYALMVYGADTADFVSLNANGNTNQMLVYAGGSAVAAIGGGSFVVGQQYKIALVYSENYFAYYINGVLKGTDTSGAVPNNLQSVRTETPFGLKTSSQKTKQLVFFPTALTDSECIALTSL